MLPLWIFLGIIHACSILFFFYNFFKTAKYRRENQIPSLPETRLFGIISFRAAVFLYFLILVFFIIQSVLLTLFLISLR